MAHHMNRTPARTTRTTRAMANAMANTMVLYSRADMMQRTRSITERYLKEKDTIAVVVVPANITRVRDSQVHARARGKEGERGERERERALSGFVCRSRGGAVLSQFIHIGITNYCDRFRFSRIL